MKNLREEMSAIVDESVKYYKTDFEYDLNEILESGPQKYLWLIRESGTYLFSFSRLLYKGDFANETIKKYKNHSEDKTEKGFIVDVVDVKRKNYYGTIKEVNLSLIAKNILEHEIPHKSIVINILDLKQTVEITKEEEDAKDGYINEAIKEKLKADFENWRIVKYTPEKTLEI